MFEEKLNAGCCDVCKHFDTCMDELLHDPGGYLMKVACGSRCRNYPRHINPVCHIIREKLCDMVMRDLGTCRSDCPPGRAFEPASREELVLLAL